MLEDILTQKKASIVKKWLGLIADTHPAGASFFKDKDRFTNPVAYIFSSETEVLYEELLNGLVDSEKALLSLENVIKIRAVQEFSPSQAVGFVFLLKKAIREELRGESRHEQSLAELAKFESKIDELALQAFDIYTGSRERMHEVRVNEMRNERENAFRLLDRIALKYGKIEGEVTCGHNGSEVLE